MRALLGTEWIKALAALATGLWLLAGPRRDPAARPPGARRWSELRLVLLGAALALGGWLTVSRTDIRRPIHVWDTYHYYLGAKYFPELEYTGLYDCSVVADSQDAARGDLASRTIRDLATNRMERAALILADPGRCLRRFEEGRWQQFKRDVAWFRDQVPAARWADMQKDHGFNASPGWILMGRILTATGPAGTTQIFLISVVDYLLLGLMWILVFRAFGWTVLWGSAAYWATNYPARFYWTAGAMLRQPWLALTVASLCWWKQERPLRAGAALAAAAMTRVFPALLLVGPLGNLVRRCISDRRLRLSPDQRRFALGMTLALAVLVPAATFSAGGVGAWPAFFQDLTTHMATPSTNTMGLKVVASFSPGSRARLLRQEGGLDPYAGWREARLRVFEGRRPMFLLLAAGFLALLLRGAAGRPDWEAAALSAGLLPVALELACYYYSVLLVFGLLLGRSRRVAAALNLHAFAGWMLVMALPHYDEHYAALSLLSVAFVLGVTAAYPDLGRE